MLHYIRKVVPLENFLLQITFKNGEVKIFDAKPHLAGAIFAPLHDPHNFAQVKVDAISGAIFWPNGADFCPDFVHSLPEAELQIAPELDAVAA